jgi:ABC-type antimicrobial peptide transport system permease subunit
MITWNAETITAGAAAVAVIIGAMATAIKKLVDIKTDINDLKLMVTNKLDTSIEEVQDNADAIKDNVMNTLTDTKSMLDNFISLMDNKLQLIAGSAKERQDEVKVKLGELVLKIEKQSTEVCKEHQGNIKVLTGLLDDVANDTEKLSAFHDKTDENGVPLCYKPRHLEKSLETILDTVKNMLSVQQTQLNLLESQQKTLTKIEDKILK